MKQNKGNKEIWFLLQQIYNLLIFSHLWPWEGMFGQLIHTQIFIETLL